jgi:phenylalanyl-tRNA synthetase beta chain
VKILTSWLRELLPGIPLDDAALAADLTLRGIAVDGTFAAVDGGSVFEMDITTNRVDAMNHYGVAREAATIYGLALPALAALLPDAKAADAFAVTVEEPALCGRFTARVLRGVTIRPSHADIAARFGALELKAINNAVDASNATLQQMGHPTHAFDLDRIAGGRIVVRLARAGEKLTTLDGVERTLNAEDLVIADAEKAISLAGIMGGWETRVTDATRNILVESAWFDPDRIRRTARRHGMHTDASHRFERGADFAAAALANDLVCAIILRDGGELVGGLADVHFAEAASRTANRAAVPLRLSEVARMLGTTADSSAMDSATVEPLLTGLGCRLERVSPNEYAVTLPSWRLDLAREIDLIEEVARVYGYNRFANTLPAFSGAVRPLPTAAQENAVRQTLLAAGFNEALSSTFCSATAGTIFAAQPGQLVPMGNPLSEEASILRPSLLPGMVAMLEHNLNHGAETVRLFEAGTVFTGSAARVEEKQSLAIGLTVNVTENALYAADAAAFFALKGVLESLLRQFATTGVYFDSSGQPDWLQMGRGARIVVNGATLGWLGQLAAEKAALYKLRQPVWLAELSLDALFALPLRAKVARDISRFPAVERDFSFVFADAVQWHHIAAALDSTGMQEMTGHRPLEIFRDAKGANVPLGHYSLLVRAVFQSAVRTLTEQDLSAFNEKVIAALTAAGGTLRG